MVVVVAAAAIHEQNKQAAALGVKAGHQHAGTPVSLLYPPFFSPSHAKEPFFCTDTM